MLQAEIHGKLALDDESAQGLERIEDVLTSSVVGTLLIAGADDLLIEWLGTAHDLDGRALSVRGPVQDYWFWPRLQGNGVAIEPDVLFLLGGALVVIEAKYRASASNRSAAEDAPERHERQLAGQWLACRPDAQRAPGYPPELRAALAAEDAALVYLVRGKSTAKSRHEMREALRETPEARLFLLTWESLHRLVDARVRAGTVPRWVGELETLLRRRSLVAFSGCQHRVQPGLRSQALVVQTWRPFRAAFSGRMRFAERMARRRQDLIRRLGATFRTRIQNWPKEER